MRTTAASAPAGSPENERRRRRARRPTSAEWGRAAGWKEDRVRGKKRETLLSGKAKGPGDLRGDVIANGAGQDAAHGAEQCPGGASLWSGVHPSCGFAIQQLFTLMAGNLSHLLGGSRVHHVRETRAQGYNDDSKEQRRFHVVAHVVHRRARRGRVCSAVQTRRRRGVALPARTAASGADERSLSAADRPPPRASSSSRFASSRRCRTSTASPRA